MPNNRLKPPVDRTESLYREILSYGFTLHADGDGLRIEPADKVTPGLRERVRRNEAALLAHLRTLPPKTWCDVGRADGFEEVEPLAF